MRTVKSWARTVTRHSHLAERVRALALRLPATLTFDAQDATKIARALSRCSNLKELRVAGPVCFHGWMINEAPFRLTKFENRYFEDRWIGDFWKAQTEIRVLSISYTSSRFDNNQLLPNLIAIRTSYLHNLPAGRPLQRIETTFHRDLAPLMQYARTLTTLNLLREWRDHELSISDILVAIADLAALAHLGITELRKERSTPAIEVPPIAILRQFSKIETFILLVRNVTRFLSDDLHNSYDMTVAADVEGLGSAIMAACPTLWRVAVGAQVAWDQELSSVLTKSRGGEIHAEAGTALDFEAVSMFWNP
ncbi:hypothetical protein B0H13DRAFT_2670013 [Mycena leptocephala]|nr:hypothetical protein B0H13DRAFT_2670013 [Mycena leptocephala]